MHEPVAVNSRQWWEAYFQETWEANDGKSQTRHFMRRLLANVPEVDLEFLLSRPLEILDWGCAMGEGADVLARALVTSHVTGLDFSTRAIASARESYPHCAFIWTPEGEILESYDVIVVSNCLEHFEDPLALVEAHLAHCRQLYVALVPYNEHPLHEQHRTQFRDDSFPCHIGAFTRVHLQAIDVDQAFWPGQQLLALYASPDYLKHREAAAHAHEDMLEDASGEQHGGPDHVERAAGLAQRVALLRQEQTIRAELEAEVSRTVRQEHLLSATIAELQARAVEF